MTIMDVIDRIDTLKPNGYLQRQKILWLSNLDLRIKEKIINAHEGSEEIVFTGYTETTPLDTTLLIQAPYDEVYLYWLEAQIDYWNGEIAKYNNSIEMFNTAYTALENHYNRTHMPKGKKFRFF